jgi:phosphatidylserine/phosphatidylglycerophosphate/cardiolipin synthase-like enzyme/subtilisin family serine protease
VDPALWELLRAEAGADGDRVLEAAIRLARPGLEIPDVRIVSRFGTIVTCRIRARDVVPVRARPDVISFKAARGLSPEFEPSLRPPDSAGPALPGICPTDVRRSPGLALTGKGVVLASVDWGVDVGAAAFRWPADPVRADSGHAPGGTRFLSFWDQRDQAVGPRPEPYGYGTVHGREQIDSALLDPRPYERLGYHPAIADPAGRGAHGTHVLDIAAGNGQAGGPVGIAPEADLIFVHLADRRTGGLANLGDSVRLLEAVDFISRTAGARPCVINISAGRICGPKDGTTLVERALDELLRYTPGRFVVNSAGNYFGRRTHSCGVIAQGEARSLTFVIDPADVTLNELEIWYAGEDEFTIRIDPPGYIGGRAVRLGERSDLLIEGRTVGRVYHREHDPNNGDNHIVAYIDPFGCAGIWTVTLEARRARGGRFHAWIERDDTCRGCQARFTPDDSNPVTTIGTITTSRLPLIVGAYDGHDPARQVAPFSSSGPTRDLRLKPDLVAPGVEVLAARSAPITANHNPGLLIRKSGTSMATPHVTGAVALCFEAAGRRLSAREIRALVLDSCDQVPDPDLQPRLGRGYLNIPRLVADVQQALAAPGPPPGVAEPASNAGDDVELLAAAPATAYREYLYRPRSQVARWIGDRFDIVAGPGQHLGKAAQRGDVLIEVTFGRLGGGRCVVLDEARLEAIGPRPRLLPGQLVLRPHRHAERPNPSAGGCVAGDGDIGPLDGESSDGRAVLFRLATWPATVRQAFSRGRDRWREAVREAIRAGTADPQSLADLIFFMQHPERMTGGTGKPLEESEAEFAKLRAEWTLYLTIVTRILKPATRPTVFLPARASRNYEEFVAAPTTGKVTLMVHGRNSDGSGHADPRTGDWDGFRDDLETFARMQETVESLGAGDSLLIASWQFAPTELPLAVSPAGSKTRTWADLFADKACEDVRIRVIIAVHPLSAELGPLNTVITKLPLAKQDNFKYIVSAHPHGAGVHHQKLVVARKGMSTIAFCGGLDISFDRAPQGKPRPHWGPQFVWHDVNAKVEGLVAHDLEREFVERWNREKGKSLAGPLPGWTGLEELARSGVGEADQAADLNKHHVQMLRTVSAGPSTPDNQRDDIWQGYFRLIGRATRFIYLEDQYFHEPRLADAIVRQAEAQPGLIVIVMVGTGTDDRQTVDPGATGVDRIKQLLQVRWTQGAFAQRLEFFSRLSVAPLTPDRLRIYTLNYPDGILHSKLILVDDEALSVGSANANPRGFFFDTELNLMLDHAETVTDFRQRLWAHNLGVARGTVAAWAPSQFLAGWDAVAQSNQRLQATPTRMVGEGVIPFRPLDPKDPRFRRGMRTFDPAQNVF